MSRARLAAASLGGLLLLSALGTGCGGGDDAGVSEVTLPSSLSITTTVPGDPDPTLAPETSTTALPATNPAGSGAPVITALRAEPGAAGCVAGTIPAVVTFEVAAEPPVRVFSVFLDGAPAGSSNTAAPITIAAVPCDGEVHMVLFIATGTGTDPQSSTQAVAFRAPLPT